MSLLRPLINLLLGRRGPSFDWVPDPRVRLSVDLDRHAFCGVPVGSSLQRLSFLGPSDSPRAQGYVLHYRDKGLYLVHDEGQFTTLVVLLSDSSLGHPYAGTWQYQGAPLQIDSGTTPQQLTEMLGEPYWQFTDTTGDVVWFYEHGAVEWQFAWKPSGALASLEIGPPELADEGSRASYGVTKPWPPRRLAEDR